MGEGTGLTEQWVAGGGARQPVHQGRVEDEVAQQQGHFVGGALCDPKGQQPPTHISQQQRLPGYQQGYDGL